MRGILSGELRQGALAGVFTTAVAKAADVPVAAVRRAAMMAGDLGVAAVAALTGGRSALDAIDLEPLRPVQPMLASPAADVAEAMTAIARRAGPSSPRSTGNSTAHGSRLIGSAGRSGCSPATSTTSPLGCPRWPTCRSGHARRRPRARRRGDGHHGRRFAQGVPGLDARRNPTRCVLLRCAARRRGAGPRRTAVGASRGPRRHGARGVAAPLDRDRGRDRGRAVSRACDRLWSRRGHGQGPHPSRTRRAVAARDGAR